LLLSGSNARRSTRCGQDYETVAVGRQILGTSRVGLFHVHVFVLTLFLQKDKNKELEAKTMDLERKWLEERSLREAAEAKVKALKKKLRTLAERGDDEVAQDVAAMGEAEEQYVAPDEGTANLTKPPMYKAATPSKPANELYTDEMPVPMAALRSNSDDAASTPPRKFDEGKPPLKTSPEPVIGVRRSTSGDSTSNGANPNTTNLRKSGGDAAAADSRPPMSHFPAVRRATQSPNLGGSGNSTFVPYSDDPRGARIAPAGSGSVDHFDPLRPSSASVGSHSRSASYGSSTMPDSPLQYAVTPVPHSASCDQLFQSLPNVYSGVGFTPTVIATSTSSNDDLLNLHQPTFPASAAVDSLLPQQQQQQPDLWQGGNSSGALIEPWPFLAAPATAPVDAANRADPFDEIVARRPSMS
jgi:hypothetical protein